MTGLDRKRSARAAGSSSAMTTPAEAAATCEKGSTSGGGCVGSRTDIPGRATRSALPDGRRLSSCTGSTGHLPRKTVARTTALTSADPPTVSGMCVRFTLGSINALAVSAAVEFTYRLTGTGWAEARIADGTSSATITASYLGDALCDLLEAVGVLLEGAEEARCSWEEEPGEYRWIFERTGSDVGVRVLALSDNFPREPDERGVVVFETRTPLREVARAVVEGAQKALDHYGEEEYLRRWVDHPFPVGYLELIQTRLASG
jgi:hypothetical protein